MQQCHPSLTLSSNKRHSKTKRHRKKQRFNAKTATKYSNRKQCTRVFCVLYSNCTTSAATASSVPGYFVSCTQTAQQADKHAEIELEYQTLLSSRLDYHDIEYVPCYVLFSLLRPRKSDLKNESCGLVNRLPCRYARYVTVTMFLTVIGRLKPCLRSLLVNNFNPARLPRQTRPQTYP